MTSYEKDDERYEYTYNSDGMRTSKKRYSDGELAYIMTYVWDGDVLLANRLFNPESNDSVIISYLYDADDELFGMEYNGNGVFAYTKNLQGDIVGIIPLDNESTADVGIEYDAWGYPHYRQGSSIAEGFLIAIMAALNAVGYRGYFFDMDTRLYYLRSRYYDPETGRFINADDTNYLGYDGSPLSLNLFAYCCNNPVNYIDYYGLVSSVIIAGTIVAVGGITGVIAYKKSLAVKMYMLSIANAKKNLQYIDFQQNNEYKDFYEIIVKRFKE